MAQTQGLKRPVLPVVCGGFPRILPRVRRRASTDGGAGDFLLGIEHLYGSYQGPATTFCGRSPDDSVPIRARSTWLGRCHIQCSRCVVRSITRCHPSYQMKTAG